MALRNKLERKDVNFGGVWFPEDVTFSGAVAFSEDASFYYATFNGNVDFYFARFSAKANFGSAIFNADADFRLTSFCADSYFHGASFRAGADFYFASFSEIANFEGTSFSANANFCDVTFSAVADFRQAKFSARADFDSTKFKDYVRFSGTIEKKMLGETPRLNLQFAQMEKPERVSFHTLILRPNWFTNIDSRKFEFIDVDWNFRLKEELSECQYSFVGGAPNRLLSIAYRQLADNAETNHRYLEASRFRYNAFEARRIEKFSGFVPWRLDWWYWLASGYGESVGRAALVFIALLALFTFGYQRSEFMPAASTATPSAIVMAQGAQPATPELAPKRLGWREAALYSFNVSLLQKPEPKPKGLWSSFLVALQTVLGPAQAALLALAVRRRFMR